MSRVTAIGNSSSTVRGAKRVADIVAALTPPPVIAGEEEKPAAPIVKVEPPKERPKLGSVLRVSAPGVVGAISGAVVWKQHRVLGALAGHAIGDNVLPIINGDSVERRDAMYRLGIEGAGVVGALLVKRTVLKPLGWLAGIAAGMAVSAVIPNNPVVAAAKGK